MKLLFLIGNSSVGKMTVGQELCKITPLRLFHNHMIIEPVLEVFGEFKSDTIAKLRRIVFEDFSKTDHYGMVFTFMWAFDMQSDWDYIESVKEIFGLTEEDVYHVELIAPQQVRLQRNCTENRLKNKASKRDVAASNARLIRDDENYRCESLPGEITFPNYLRTENASLSPAETARLINERFKFSEDNYV